MEQYSQQITFNGKTFATKDDMPPAERNAFEALTRFFADSNGNSVADRFEASGQFEVGKYTVSARINAGAKEILINGKCYSDPSEMTVEDRRVYEGALALLDKNGNGVPDVFEALTPEQIQAAFGKGFTPKPSARKEGSFFWPILAYAASSVVLWYALGVF